MLAPPCIRKRELFVSSRMIPFLGFLFCSALVIGYVLWQAALISAQPKLFLTSPADGERVVLPRVEIIGETDPSALVRVNGELAVVQQNGIFRLSLNIPHGVTTIRVEASRRYGSASFIERHVLYDRAIEINTTVSSTTSTPS